MGAIGFGHVKHGEHGLGPPDLIIGDIPYPATDVSDPLRFGESILALLKLFDDWSADAYENV